MRNPSRIAWLATAAALGQAAFIGAWFVLGLIEGHGYSPAEDNISDLGAPTAHHVGWWLTAGAVSGVATIAFALWALRPALDLPGKRAAAGAWLVAISLPAIDNVGDTFFRLDCRAADAGCTAARSMASWHGKAHGIVFVVALLPTLVAPFALAHRMKELPAWRDLVRPARGYGVVFVAGVVLAIVTTGSGVQGWTQRFLTTLVPLGVVALALRVRRLARMPGP